MTEQTHENMEAQQSSAPLNGDARTTAQAKQDDLLGRVATVAVVGVGAALISAELIPGLLIGAIAASLPNFLPKLGQGLRPAMRSTVRASYKFAQKTREAFAEAGEQVQDLVAEARLEHAQTEVGTAAADGAAR